MADANTAVIVLASVQGATTIALAVVTGLYVRRTREISIATQQQAQATRLQADASVAMVREMQQERYQRKRNEHCKRLEAYVGSVSDDITAFAYEEADYDRRELRKSLLHHYPALARASDEGTHITRELASALDLVEAKADGAAVAAGYFDSGANLLIREEAKRLALTFHGLADNLTVDYDPTSGWIHMGAYSLVDRHYHAPSREELADARRQIRDLLQACASWKEVTTARDLEHNRRDIEARFRRDKARIAGRLAHTLDGDDCEICPTPALVLANG